MDDLVDEHSTQNTVNEKTMDYTTFCRDFIVNVNLENEADFTLDMKLITKRIRMIFILQLSVMMRMTLMTSEMLTRIMII